MKVKIISSDMYRWYKDEIGNEFEVIDAPDVFEIANTLPGELKKAILKRDCIIIEDQPSFSLPPDYVVMGNLHVVTADGKRYRLVPEDRPLPDTLQKDTNISVLGATENNRGYDFDKDMFIHIGDEVRKLTEEEKYILFPERYYNFEVPKVKEPELNTFEDCWNKVRPAWASRVNGEVYMASMGENHILQNSLDHVPSEKSALQIQAAIKLFVIHSALCGGMPEAVYSKSVTHWEVCFHDDIKHGIFPSKVSHGICTQFMFPTEELAQKSIDIGIDIWRTYFGL